MAAVTGLWPIMLRPDREGAAGAAGAHLASGDYPQRFWRLSPASCPERIPTQIGSCMFSAIKRSFLRIRNRSSNLTRDNNSVSSLPSGNWAGQFRDSERRAIGAPVNSERDSAANLSVGLGPDVD